MELNRREWCQVVAGGVLLSGTAPEASAQESGGKIRYCIVGLGRISMQHFMPAVKISSHSKITALVSGHRDKAEKEAAKYGVPAKNIYSYENYDEIADNKDIDAVYIALPNSMHAEYTIRAAKAGKHVLMRKADGDHGEGQPGDDRRLPSGNAKLMIAYRCQFEPTNLRAIKMIRDGQLGKIQAIESAQRLQYQTERMAAEQEAGRRRSADGCRNLFAECLPLSHRRRAGRYRRLCIRDRPRRPLQRGRGEPFVDDEVSFRDRGELQYHLWRNMPGFYRVHGSKGYMHVEPSFGYDGLRLTAHIQGESPLDEPNREKDPAQFLREGDYFAQCITKNQEPKPDGEEGLRDMKLMAAIYESCKRRS